jgi:hypothetical protein
MINFETKFFQKTTFTANQLIQYIASAERDYAIAAASDIPEVVFKFSYDAFIKIGIALIAKAGYKVRSMPGHHVKIIEKLAEILGNEDAAIIGNRMRQNRNTDFYDGGTIISQTEAAQYLKFVGQIIQQAKRL